MNFNSVFLHLLDMILKFYTKKEIFRTNILKESYTRFSADSSFFLMKKNQRKNCLQAQIMIQIEKLFFCLKDWNIALHLNAKPHQDSSHKKNLTTFKVIFVAYFSLFYPLFIALLGAILIFLEKNVLDSKI